MPAREGLSLVTEPSFPAPFGGLYLRRTLTCSVIHLVIPPAFALVAIHAREACLPQVVSTLSCLLSAAILAHSSSPSFPPIPRWLSTQPTVTSFYF